VVSDPFGAGKKERGGVAGVLGEKESCDALIDRRRKSGA